MGLVLLGDVHFTVDQPIGRKDILHETLLRKLKYVLEYSRNNGHSIVQAGDLFHTPRSWRSLSSFSSLLFSYPEVGFYCVAGQHDMYLYNQESFRSTSMGILSLFELIKLLGEEKTEIEGINLYGSSFGQPIPVPKDDEGNVLVIHKMILMNKLWGDQDKYNYAPEFLMEHPEFDLILCGDAHQKFVFVDDKRRKICNSGPISRREASREMFEHRPGFYVFNPNGRNIFWEEIPHDAADDVLSRDHIETVKSKNEYMDTFVEALKNTGIGEGSDFSWEETLKENLERFLSSEGIIEEGEIRKILANVMEEGE